MCYALYLHHSKYDENETFYYRLWSHEYPIQLYSILTSSLTSPPPLPSNPVPLIWFHRRIQGLISSSIVIEGRLRIEELEKFVNQVSAHNQVGAAVCCVLCTAQRCMILILCGVVWCDVMWCGMGWYSATQSSISYHITLYDPPVPLLFLCGDTHQEVNIMYKYTKWCEPLLTCLHSFHRTDLEHY
jgi:hypothetical protein